MPSARIRGRGLCREKQCSLTDAQKQARIRRIRSFSRGRVFQVLTPNNASNYGRR